MHRDIKFYLFLICLNLLLLTNGCGGGSPPKELAKGRVVVEKQRYNKEIFYKAKGLNLIWQLKKVNYDNNDKVLVVGGDGACLLALNGKLLQSISYKPQYAYYDVRIDDVNNDGKYEYFSRVLWGEPPVVLLDHQGNMLWEYKTGKKYPHLPPPIAIDVNDDRIKEIVIPTINPTVFDASGNLLKETNLKGPLGEKVEVADFNGDGRSELLYYSATQSFIIQKVNGEVISRFKPTLDNFTFSKTYWVNNSNAHLLLVGSEKMHIINHKGEKVAIFNTPYTSYSYQRPDGMPLLLNKEKNDYGYISSIKGRGGWHRTVIYVNALSGELLYQEIVEEDCDSLYAFNDTDDKKGSFLVGCRNCIWLYTPDK
jgi:hypothetical protein